MLTISIYADKFYKLARTLPNGTIELKEIIDCYNINLKKRTNMAKYYETTTIFNFKWDQVAQGFWHRYPNPHR